MQFHIPDCNEYGSNVTPFLNQMTSKLASAIILIEKRTNKQCHASTVCTGKGVLKLDWLLLKIYTEFMHCSTK